MKIKSGYRYLKVNPLVFLCYIVCTFNLVSGQSPAVTRPKVGIVLSGGAAKGLAHIGVIKVIEEAGIPVDFIAGTSMGAIIGGLYSVGYDAHRLENITVHQNWNKLLSDYIPRTDLSVEEKKEEDLFFVSFPFGKSGVKIPSGIISGQNIENLINTLCIPAYKTRNFNQLRIPFLCVAMDIISGKEVVMRDGYLPDAMRASMAIPTLFEAIPRDSFLLVDGGVINNFPADRLKELGADIIIGVDVGYVEPQPTVSYDLFKIFEQTVFLSSEPRIIANRKLCNILITPDLTGYGSSDFNDADTLIARGEKAARLHISELYALRDSLRNYPDYAFEKPELHTIDSVFLKEIQIHGLDRVSARLITGKLQLNMLSWIKPDDIKTAVNNAFSSLYFSKVTYELQPFENEKSGCNVRLIIHVTEKEGGLLRIGINYNSYYKASIIMNATFRNILLAGSKLSVNLGLGDSPKFLASYFKNNGAIPGFGIDIEGQNMDIYYYKAAHKITTIDFTDISFRIYTQSIFKNSIALGGGFEYEFANLKPVVGEVMPESKSNRFYNGYFFMHIDRFDDASYPTNGSRFFAMYKMIHTSGIDYEHLIHFRYEKALPVVKQLTFIPSVFGGYASADSSERIYQLYLGGMNQLNNKGLLPFAGLDFMQVNNRITAGMGAGMQYNFWRNNFVVLKVNAGSAAWNPEDLFGKGSGLYGFGITLGNNSIIGPIEITFMVSNVHHDLLSYFNIGYWF
jgi:NTE family protein